MLLEQLLEPRYASVALRERRAFIGCALRGDKRLALCAGCAVGQGSVPVRAARKAGDAGPRVAKGDATQSVQIEQPDEQLLAMGERLETTLSGLQTWQSGHDRRLMGSCLGMLAMVLWLFGGWLLGLSVWLGGMAVIAVATWLIRPRKRPDVLFGDLDIDLVPKALEAGRDALGEGWEDIANSVAAIPLWGDYVRLSVLERNVSIQRLKQAFEPSEIARILHTVAPVD